MSNIIAFPTDDARGASQPAKAAPGNVIRFPTAVAQARAWITRMQHRRAHTTPPAWLHTCAASGQITLGLISQRRCPFCDTQAPTPGDDA